MSKKNIIKYNQLYSDFFSSDFCSEIFFTAIVIHKYNPKRFFWEYQNIAFDSPVRKYLNTTPSRVLFPSLLHLSEFMYEHQDAIKSFIDSESKLSVFTSVMVDFPANANHAVLRKILDEVMQVIAQDFFLYCEEAGYFRDGFSSLISDIT